MILKLFKRRKWIKKEMKRLEDFVPYDEVYHAYFKSQSRMRINYDQQNTKTNRFVF